MFDAPLFDNAVNQNVAAKILFADDDPLMHRLYQHHIERAGYEFIGVTNGREAVEAAGRQHPDVAVVDLVMPELDGVAVVLALKGSEATRKIPVMLITGDPNYYLCQRQFAEAGASVFLSKPFGPGQLLQAIHRLLPQTTTTPA
jgi:CheY-like chemotaxis protein